jgi:hypothetical protein
MRKTRHIQLPGSNSHKGYFTNKDVRKIQGNYNKHIEIFSEKTLSELEVIEESKVYEGKKLSSSSFQALTDSIFFKKYKTQKDEKEQQPTE